MPDTAEQELARPRSVSVVAPDLGSAAALRAFNLAAMLSRRHRVRLVGPTFTDGVWRPIRGTEVTVRAFGANQLPRFVADAEEFVRGLRSEVVIVSRPELPALLVGALIKHVHGAPLIVDIDRTTLPASGARAGEPVPLDELERRRHEPQLQDPRDALWTAACQTLLPDADAVLVASEPLRQLYGGQIVPHVRDERVFDPSAVDRDAARRELGFARVDRVVAAAGSGSDGLVACAAALRGLRDPRFKLLVVGPISDQTLRAELGRVAASRITLVEPTTQSQQAAAIAAADLCFLHDDPASAAPSGELAEALGVGTPVLVDGTEVLTRLEREVVHLISGENLSEQLAELLSNPESLRVHVGPGREHFRNWLSYDAYLEPINRALSAVIDTRSDVGEGLGRLHRVAGRGRPARAPAARRRIGRTPEQWDVAFFWYLNDSWLYGRRSDMLMKHLAQADWTRRLVHFDMPATWGYVTSRRAEAARGLTHWDQIARRTRKLAFTGERRGKLRSYTFVPQSSKPKRLEGSLLPPADEYLGFVQHVLERNGVGKRPLICWAWPPNRSFEQIHALLSPTITVADVVDDERSWHTPGTVRYEQTTRNYERIFELSDLVITNTELLAERLRWFGVDPAVVPNAMEVLPAPTRSLPRPAELRRLHGPLLGYVGGLSWRIDVELLDRLARARPDCQIVIIGSAHGPRDVLALASHPNVHFLGVRPYPEVLRYVRCFDVALIPHLDNEMTRAMNPLKAFMYLSCGVPIVSTGIASLDALDGEIRFTDSHEAFIAAVSEIVARPPDAHREPSQQLIDNHSWQTRIAQIERLLDHRASSSPAPDPADLVT